LERKGDKPAQLHMDNQSAIHVSKKGRGTFKRTKHIKVRFFWLKDLIDNGELNICYTCTSEMVADILTKPLVGTKFKYLKDKLLGTIE
jgi:hypothetical protein